MILEKIHFLVREARAHCVETFRFIIIWHYRLERFDGLNNGQLQIPREKPLEANFPPFSLWHDVKQRTRCHFRSYLLATNMVASNTTRAYSSSFDESESDSGSSENVSTASSTDESVDEDNAGQIRP